MLGLGHGVSTIADFEWGNTKYLSFDGTDDKAEFEVTSAFKTAIADGDVGDNIGFSFWIKPTWDTSGSGSGFAPRKIRFFYIGKADDVHESVRGFYDLSNSSGTAQNRLFSELRSTTGTNARQADYSALHSNNSVTGVGTNASDLWKTDNPSGEGWVHVVMTRATGEWNQYWNGSALTETDNDSGTLNIDNSLARVFNLGYIPTEDAYYKYGVRDFAIFNTELSSANATTLYNSGSFTDVRDLGISSLSVYYPLNENSRDIVGGFDLVLTGGAFTAL